MIAKIKKLRVEIDGLYQLTKELKPLSTRVHNYGDHTFKVVDMSSNSKEIEEAAKSLLLAKAWLGKLLQDLGDSTPYTPGKKTVADIEPTAEPATLVPGMRQPFNKGNSKRPALPIDTWELNGRSMADYDRMNHIEKVDYIREEIQTIIRQYYIPNIEGTTYYGEIAIHCYYQHLYEARMWLGFEFARIRESNK